MIISRTAEQCGKANYGWLQARYTFSFGHYFDPQLLGYASLRVLNQEVLSPGAACQPRTYPKVDVLNLVLQGKVEYRDSEGNHITAEAGDALLLATQPGISYSEHNVGKDNLTRLQLWLSACPDQMNSRTQRISAVGSHAFQLLASPDGSEGSLQLRQQAWIYQIVLQPGESHEISLRGTRAYLQSVHGALTLLTPTEQRETLTCGDGAFIQEEQRVRLTAETPLRALIIDLAE